jgi:hypothetical protein
MVDKENTYKKQLYSLNLIDLKKQTLKLINFMRHYSGVYANLLKKKKISFIDNSELDEIYFKLIKIPPGSLTPLINHDPLNKCAESLLYYLTLHDKGKNEVVFNPLESKDYSLKARLSRSNLYSGKFHEYIIFNALFPEEIVLNLLLNDKNKNRILNNIYNYIGIAIGILPSNRLCVVIDLTQTFDKNKPSKKVYNPNYEDYLEYYHFDKDKDNNNKDSVSYNINYDKSTYKYNPKDIFIKKTPIQIDQNQQIIPNINRRGVIEIPQKIEDNNNLNNSYIIPQPNFVPYGLKTVVVKPKQPPKKTYQTSTFNPSMMRMRNKLGDMISPVKVSLERSFIKDEEGNDIPVIQKKSKFVDGSVNIEYGPDSQL